MRNILFLALLCIFQFLHANNLNDYHGPLFICSKEKCPIISIQGRNKITANCTFNDNRNWWDCNLVYENENSETVTLKPTDIFFLKYNTEINWLSNNLAQVKEFMGQGNPDTFSIFINFNTMQRTGILTDVFAINPEQQVIAYFNQNKPYHVEIAKIFNLKKAIPLSGNNYINFPDFGVILPTTHFDKNGNLVLVYQDASKNYARTTKVIAIDYSQLK